MTARQAYEELEQLTPARAMAVYLMDSATDEAKFQKGRELFLLTQAGIEACLDAIREERAEAAA